MSDRIRGLAAEVVQAFQFRGSSERVNRLQQVENELLVGMLPVINWLERRRPADTAALVTRRAGEVVREAVLCASLDIPEYAGGRIASGAGDPSSGMVRTATLMVHATALAESLLQWAKDIEEEDGHLPSLPGRKEEKVAGAGSTKASPPAVPERYRKAVNLWPTFRKEMTKTVKRATLPRFRTWLKRRKNPILLDEYFDTWWNDIYSRQLRRRTN